MNHAPRHRPGAIDDADREGVLNPPAGAQSRVGEPEPSAPGSSRARSEGALSGMAWGPAAVKGVTV